MKKEKTKLFNEEVEKYRKLLLRCCNKSEWNIFKMTAGRLFDYIESIEILEVQKKFFKIFKVMLAVVVLSVIFILKMNINILPDIGSLRNLALFTAVAGCCFELYFFINFRSYMEYKTTYYKKRREKFIRDLEIDFKEA